MTKQTTNNDILLGLWALEQNLKENELKNDRVMFLYSGGQDSSTLGWFLYHTVPNQQKALNLMHFAHLMQHDNFFMAQHAVSLSFWLGWQHTTFFPSQALISEKQASYQRTSFLRRVGAYTSTHVAANGHTETDKRESDFFKFARTPESINYTPSTGHHLTTELCIDTDLTFNYTGTRAKNEWGTYPRPTLRPTKNARCAFCEDVRADVRADAKAVYEPFADPNLCRPLMRLSRKDTRTVTTLQKLPIYPDQTNFECQTTRTQVRYLVFPLLAKLGFKLFE